MTSSSAAPLDGLRVVDLTSVFLGPYATLILADLGADVIKVEPPAGDVVRFVGPHRNPGMGPMFLAANRNKRSVALDLKDVRARAALLSLVERADVFVHNMRPLAAANLGIDHSSVSARNRGIVYCATYGYDESGPYAGRPAYDDTIQAVSGVAALQEPWAGEPQYVGTVMADKTVALAVVIGVLGALHHRQRTGQGQAIDITMYETMASFVLLEHLYGETFVPSVGEARYPRATSPSRRPHKTADGWISVMLYSDAHWRRFFDLAGRGDLVDDPRVTDITLRTEHIDELYGEVAELLGTRTTAEWLEVLGEADIPAAPVHWPHDLLEDGHLRAVGLLEEVDHPTEGRIRQVLTPWRLRGTPLSSRRAAPRLGEHTREVLADAGLDSAAIDQLVADGVAVES